MIRRASIPLILAALLSMSPLALGQVHMPLSVSPLSVYSTISPGDSFSGSFTVQNRGADPVAVNVSLADFLFGEMGGIDALEPGTLGDYSLSPYITYTPEHMVVGPGESKRVTFTFDIPAEAPGPHWAALIVMPETREEVELEQEDEGFEFLVRLGWHYFFTIIHSPPDAGLPLGQVVGMDVRGATAEDGSKRLTVNVAFQNLVEAVARCTVYFEIRDPEGGTLARHESEHERFALPGAMRVFSHTFAGLDMPPGEYLILGVVDFGGEHLTAGQYVATVRE